MFRWRRKRHEDVMDADVAKARAEREKSEQRLAEAKRDVIRPLHEMRQHDTVSAIIDELIERKVQERGSHG
jgi:hypothetical protein